MTPPRALAPSLIHPRLTHGFFGRRGGVSEGLYASLNAGPGSQDAPEAVVENRRRIAASLGVAPDCLMNAHQVHSATAVHADGPWAGPRPQADAIVTTRPGVAVAALAADCAPVLFADVDAGVVAAAHAGWRGALDGVLEATIAQMAAAGAHTRRIVAAIGPCIAQRSYEVGPEFRARFGAGAQRFFSPGREDRWHFDLSGYCASRLAAAGVARIDLVDADTCACEAEYFSNRRGFLRSDPDYGRNLSAIALVA